jgi:hydrophobic/amphiphilic exporter-1 (mainly G- bacteria), HAE1 family
MGQVIAVSILVSGFVSLSLTPMLCSRFLRPVDHRKQSKLYQTSERIFDGWLGLYDRSLKQVLKYHRTTMILSGVLLLVTVGLFTIVPKGFIPSEDTGQITGITQVAQDGSFASLVKHQQAAADLIRKNPNVEAVNSNIGAGSSATGSGVAVASNSGSLFIKLKSRDERQASADEVVQDLQSKLADIPGLQVFLQTPPAIPIGTQQTTGAYQIALQSTDVEPLKNYVPQLVAKLRLLPELQDVNSDLQMTSQVKIEID